jgi:hypothetical protein
MPPALRYGRTKARFSKFSSFLEVLAIFSCLDNGHVELSAKGHFSKFSSFLEVFIIP